MGACRDCALRSAGGGRTQRRRAATREGVEDRRRDDPERRFLSVRWHATADQPCQLETVEILADLVSLDASLLNDVGPLCDFGIDKRLEPFRRASLGCQVEFTKASPNQGIRQCAIERRIQYCNRARGRVSWNY